MDFDKMSAVACTAQLGKPSKGSNFALYGLIEQIMPQFQNFKIEKAKKAKKAATVSQT